MRRRIRRLGLGIGVATVASAAVAASAMGAPVHGAPQPAQVRAYMKAHHIAVGPGPSRKAPTAPSRAATREPAPHFGPVRNYPAIGKAQYDAARGVYRYRQADGTYAQTDGGDRLSTAQLRAANPLTTPLPNLTAYPPVCTSSGHRFRLIYAYPAGSPNDLAAKAAGIRQAFAKVNGKLIVEANRSSSFGRSASFKTECDGSGQPAITALQVPQPTLTSVTTAIQTTAGLGYTTGTDAVRYVVFLDAPPAQTTNPDGSISSTLGVTDPPGYETDTPGNYAKTASCLSVLYCHTTAAVIWGQNNWTTHVLLHEIGHALGAVQRHDNPTSTDGAHCIDGWDVMCYDDGQAGSELYSETKCPRTLDEEDDEPFDCGYDTYFSTASHSPRNWTDKYWNVGGKEDDFLTYTPPWPSSANGDGKSDLVVTVPPSGQMAVALSSGSALGAAGTGFWMTWGAVPSWSATGDFNGDGRTDMVVFDPTTHTYWVEPSDGTQFGAPGTGGLWLTLGTTPTWAGVGDFNGTARTTSSSRTARRSPSSSRTASSSARPGAARGRRRGTGPGGAPATSTGTARTT